MKLYFLAVCLVSFFVVNVGMVLPFLFSAQSNIAVALGWVDVVMSAPVYYYVTKYIVEGFIKEGENE